MNTAAFDVDPREERLPKWAREQMARLRQAAVEAKGRADAARLLTRADESDTLIDPYDDVPVGLGNGITVRFVLNANFHDEWIDARVTEGVLDLKAGCRLSTYPLASNHVEMGLLV